MLLSPPGLYGGAGRKVCLTAFAGAALKSPVAYTVLLGRIQDGVTYFTACSSVDEFRPTDWRGGGA